MKLLEDPTHQSEMSYLHNLHISFVDSGLLGIKLGCFLPYLEHFLPSQPQKFHISSLKPSYERSTSLSIECFKGRHVYSGVIIIVTGEHI